MSPHPLGPYPAPPGRTARRVEWSFLPPVVRRWVEGRLGSAVVEAHSQGSGFTPGMASVLVCEDGSRHFVKAASATAQGVFAEAYRTEALRLAALPEAVAAPRLRWTHEADDWRVLELEHVEARAPQRPWRRADLDACLAMLARTASDLTPAPRALAPQPLAEELADWPDLWRRLAARWDHPRLDEAAALARDALSWCAGDTVVHGDVRDDNLLVTEAGEVLLCDWNWPVRGAAWLDSLWLLVDAHGDGLDVDVLLAEHPTFAGVPADALDAALALHTGYLRHCATLRVPPTSPWLREHQRWQGEAGWRWLCERRGWDLGPLPTR